MKKQKRIVPNVIRGGVAIPLGANYFLMKGKTHEQGGIDIGKDLEVENGELMKIDKKNMTIVSNAPIMNGISPAEYALGGLKDGTFTDRFKEGFKYQEKYKDVNGLKDDGTKAKFGKEKTVDEMNSKMLFTINNDKNSLVNKTYPKNYVERPRAVNSEKDLVAGLHDISEQLKEGWYAYYQNDETNNSKNRFLKDKDTGIIYEDIFNNSNAIDLEHFDIIPYSEIRKMLPKRDYIGGDSTSVRIKAFNKIPGIKEKIKELSKSYGIDSNVLTHRFLREGFVDQIVEEYNYIPSIYQKDFWNNISNRQIDGYNSLGLDDAGTNLLEGKYNLRRDVDWWDIDTNNEKGRPVKSIATNNLWDALEIKAADMEYRQNKLSERGISKEDLPTFVNAAYNLGLYHDDLKNTEWIKRNYSVPNYYKLGGKADMKRNKRNVSSTGEKKKAELGLFDRPSFADIIKNNFGNYSLSIPTIGDINFDSAKYLNPTQSQQTITNAGTTNSTQNNTSTKRTDYLDLMIPGGADKEINNLTSMLPTKVTKTTPDPKLKSTSEAFGTSPIIKKTLTPEQKEELISGILEGGSAALSAGMLAATTATNAKMLNRLEEYKDPIYNTRQRLKTTVNRNPQLAKAKKIFDKTNKFILNNTSSSKTAYNRIRQNNLDYISNLNDIYSEKENTETSLLNQDITAANENTKYNNTLQNQIDLANTELRNTIAEKKSENKAALYQGISDIVTNMVTNYGKRKQNNKNLRVMAAGFPSITPEHLNSILYK